MPIDGDEAAFFSVFFVAKELPVEGEETRADKDWPLINGDVIPEVGINSVGEIGCWVLFSSISSS